MYGVIEANDLQIRKSNCNLVFQWPMEFPASLVIQTIYASHIWIYVSK